MLNPRAHGVPGGGGALLGLPHTRDEVIGFPKGVSAELGEAGVFTAHLSLLHKRNRSSVRAARACHPKRCQLWLSVAKELRLAPTPPYKDVKGQKLR